MVKRSVDVTVADGSFRLELAVPGNTPAPALVLVPTIFGLNGETERWLDEYSARGFLAGVYDPFWRTDPGTLQLTVEPDRERAKARRDAFVEADGVRDVAGAIDALRAMPECNGNVAVAGYCFGGRYALIAAARLDVQAAVTFHGIRMGDNLDDAAKIRVPVSFHFGDSDHSTPMTEVRAIQAAVAGNPNVELCVYEGVGHSFTWHGHALHDPAAEATSLERALNILTPLKNERTAV